ncbi:MAG: hypothetical protein JF615_07500, partial [Asticcacaulis sp.]|nr:hypothetical protein [Asticcacaulis sp.]
MKRRHFLAAGLAAATLPLAAKAQTPVVLSNALWQIRIDPATLAMTVQPAGQVAVEVSRGVATAAVTGLNATATSATWTRGDQTLTATLNDHDLDITLTATGPGTIDLIDQPPAAIGRGLILPLGEGAYAPAGHPAWREYLTGPKAELDTTEGLALPLWGLDHGAFTLHWLLTNPYNNSLVFAGEGDGIALKVSHEVISLAPTTPMTLTLHLGDTDRLAGAKRYRLHRIETNSWEPLTDKIAAAPDTAKLIGASHIYLWGNDLLGPRDVRDWPAFLKTLRGPAPLAGALRAQFEPDATQLITKSKPLAYEKAAIIAAVNAALTALARKQWQTDSADAATLVA